MYLLIKIKTLGETLADCVLPLSFNGEPKLVIA